MKKRGNIFVIIILITLSAGFLVYNYLISIYEVIYKVEPQNLYADYKSEITISAVPVNALGYRSLFREAETVYKITEGENLVKVLINNRTGGIFKIRAKDQPGLIKITAKSSLALLPSPIDIKIYPEIVEVTREVNGIIYRNYYICD